MKFSIDFVVGVAYIAFVLGSSVMMVGTMPTPRTAPYEWYTPIQITLIVAMPFVLGFMSGRKQT